MPGAPSLGRRFPIALIPICTLPMKVLGGLLGGGRVGPPSCQGSDPPRTGSRLYRSGWASFEWDGSPIRSSRAMGRSSAIGSPGGGTQVWLLAPRSLWSYPFWPPEAPTGTTPFPTCPCRLRNPTAGKEPSLAEILAGFQGGRLGLVGWCGWMEWGWGHVATRVGEGSQEERQARRGQDGRGGGGEGCELLGWSGGWDVD